MYSEWKENADYVRDCGGYVNYDERYYLCLECGEPIYEEDWPPSELVEFICPVCEWEGD